MTTRPGLGDRVANTAQGYLEGAVSGAAMAFRGVRYARAGRFMPPEAPETWTGIRSATAFGPNAPQTNANPPPGPPYVILQQIPRPDGSPPPPLPESEDCQYLNIWTSALRDGGRRPVMVWLHGGFFYGGTGSGVDGSALAGRGDVVSVSLNHRLNVFGFCDLREFGEEFVHSGNLGMLDIIAALRWIRDNIEEFGGDPDRVMVYGTSGGGMKTAFLMGSPAAQGQGLFHRAAAQSGPGLRFMEPDRAQEATGHLFRALELKQGDVAALLHMPMEQLLAGYHAVAALLKPTRFIDLPCFSPVLDSELLPRFPFAPDAAPSTRDIPMMMGWNAQEMSFFMGNDPAGFVLDEAGLAGRMEALFGDKSEGITQLYRAEYPKATPSEIWIQAHTDYSIMLPVMAQADRRVAGGGQPTFVYRLDFPSPALGGKLGALHTLEGNLLFDQVEKGRSLLGPGSAPVDLARRMSSAWVQFAATGNPNGGLAGVPDWPQYDLDRRSVMVFDEHCRVEGNPSAPIREAMADLLLA